MNLYDAKTHREVGLPTLLLDFKGREWYVLNVEQPATGGSSGRIRVSTPGETDSRTFYPGVVGCYIADAPRAEHSVRILP